jgi:glycogen debranching enzyme
VTQIAKTDLRTRARAEAEAILLANGGELGLLGSGTAYQQVWARDSMICGLGLLLAADAEGERMYARSLETLRRYQSPLGRIPHNVGRANIPDPALVAHGGRLEGGDVVVDTIHAGAVDGALWYIVGHYLRFAVTGQAEPIHSAWESLERALLWLRYQDSNECGLIEVHEAMDWADLFVNRYNVLYDNVLYYAAWKSMALLADAVGKPSVAYRRGAEDVRHKVNVVLWVGPEQQKDWDWLAGERREWLYTLRRIETELVERPFYLPYVAFRDYADRLDTLGNLLAIIMGAANSEQSAKILDYITGCGLDRPWPVRALYPPINPGEKDWRDYYRVRNLNLPHHYHNGGAWPFIGGFYVAALVAAGRFDQARRQLEQLTAMVRAGRTRVWGFNEWFHGLSGEPMGYDSQSWSAALYVFAHESVRRESVPIFGEPGWTDD